MLKEELTKLFEKVVEHIKSQAKVVGDDLSKIEQVARISANDDQEIGKLIAEAMSKVHKEGVITVEDQKVPPPLLMLSKVCSSTRIYLSIFCYQCREDGS